MSFNNIGLAMVTLFRVFTGDGWGEVLAVALGCNDDQFHCRTDGAAAAAALFFCRSGRVGRAPSAHVPKCEMCPYTH